jgi:putative transposase
MRKTRFSEDKIIRILGEHEAGRSTDEVCREYGISSATFYRWKSKYGGMTLSEAKRLKAMEDENRRLKQLVADQALDIQALKGALAKKY